MRGINPRIACFQEPWRQRTPIVDDHGRDERTGDSITLFAGLLGHRERYCIEKEMITMTYITPEQVCEITGLKYSTVLKWANSGILPARKIMNGKKSKYLFVQKEIENKIEALKIEKL